MSGKLIMTKGLPRSGKTTWAKEFLQKSGNAIRVNRDDLRSMLHNNKWNPRNEELTMKAQKAIVELGLQSGKVVVVDDTNLSTYHKERWENIARENDATFEIQKFEEDITTLISRDIVSPDQRGSDVIVRLALENNYISHADDSVIVCDLDGTLADCEHRKHYIRGICDYCGGDSRDGKDCITTAKEKAENTKVWHMKKDWDGFFNGISGDTIRENVRDMLEEFHNQGKKIIFVSARPERCRKDTETWLHRYGYYLSHLDSTNGSIPYEALLMRPNHDTRNDTLIKQEILDKYLRKEAIHTVIDDRPSVIRMWESNGLKVIDVGPGIDF